MDGSPLATPLPWDLVAPAYAAEVVPQHETYARAALQLAAPPAGSRIVDVACGPGTLAVLAARAGYLVDALDFSWPMLVQLDARIISERITGITPWFGDGEALPYATGGFAAGFSMFGLMYFADRAKGYAELRRVLARGARAVVASWQPLDRVPAIATIFGALREYMALPTDATSGAPLTTADGCRAEMAAAFSAVEVHAVAHTERWPTPAAIWDSMQRTSPPLALLRDHLSPNRWSEASARGLDALTRAFGTGPLEATVPAWLAVGTAR